VIVAPDFGIATSDQVPAGSYHRSVWLTPVAAFSKTLRAKCPGSTRPGSAVALLSPGLARRFPFSAPLRTRREVSFRFLGAGKWGDCQMNIKASGRSALILATGLFVGFAGPSQAAAGADPAAASSKSESDAGAPIALNKYAKHASHHWKTYAHRKSSKVALKSPDTKKTADAAADDGDSSPAIPPSVANANAQLTSSDTPAGNAKAMSARANDILQSAPGNPADAQPAPETPVVSADQLNDVDRALHDGTPPAPTVAMAAANARAAPTAPVMANTTESSSWDQASLIGKVFIGFGALLTMASAARMFMA